MDYIYGNEEKMELFYSILWEENPLDRMYVYWVFNGKKITPSILTNITPFTELEEHLRDMYGKQEYYVMIRRRKTMILSGLISIGVPLVFTPQYDIKMEIESLREEQLKEKRKRIKSRF